MGRNNRRNKGRRDQKPKPRRFPNSDVCHDFLPTQDELDINDSECEHLNRDPYDEPYPGDEEIAHYSSEEVKEKWPRRHCPDCRAICYESFMHYIAGDW